MVAIQPERQKQIHALLDTTSFKGALLMPLAGDASFRRYIRLQLAGHTAMLMDAPPEKEDVRPYLAVAEYLHAQGFSAPEIFARDEKSGLLLLEDLGDDSFTRVLANKGGNDMELYASAIDVLAQWHAAGAAFSDAAALPLAAYDHATLMREVTLFSDWYLPQVLGIETASEARAEYLDVWDRLLAGFPLATSHFVHRDFHADNLMWLPMRADMKRVGLLDFQDALYGDPAYDLVSLLEDARRDVPPMVVEAMISRYIAATGVDAAQFKAAYALLGAQRNCKIIGIFSRLAARDNKFAYLDFMPRVWRHLEHDLSHPLLAPLRAWVDSHVAHEFRGRIQVKHNADSLALTA